jgi:hypothetical protein
MSIGPGRQNPLFRPCSEGPLRFRVAVDETAVCRFSYASGDGPFIRIEPDFQAREGGWMGTKTGIYCISDEAGSADFDYFRFLRG